MGCSFHLRWNSGEPSNNPVSYTHLDVYKRQVEESAADVLCISTTILANLPSVAELVRAVRSQLSERAPKIVLGGAVYRLATQFAREIGATEAITDLRRGLAILCA